jgi:small subunit ribosomal protein S6
MTQTTQKTRTYETICLTKVDMPEEKWTALLDRCKKAVAENGKGEWLYEDDWGKTKISYPINKEPRAQWTYFRYKSEPAGVDELLRSLKINEFVLRQMTCRTDEEGADYNPLRATFAKDLNERDKPREWKDNRRGGGGRGGYNREGRGGYDRGDRGGDRYGAPSERFEGGADAAAPESSGPTGESKGE